MNKSKEINMEAIGIEWEKMTNNLLIDENVVHPIISKSWHRSTLAGVNPYTIDKKYFLTKEEEIEYFKNLYSTVVDEEFRSILQKIAVEFDLSFLLFDNKCDLVKILACSNNVKIMTSNCSEDIIGTNSICLALEYDMPIQVFGKEHYNKLIHQYNCSAAPIHDNNKNIIGAINIGGIITHKHTLETLGFAQSIAKIIEDKIQINHMLTQLTVSNQTLKNIIEYDSSPPVLG